MTHYSDNFIDLLEEVERQGGELLDEPCTPDQYTIMVNKARGGVKKVAVETTGCGQYTRLRLNYDPSAAVTIPGRLDKDPEAEDIDMPGDHGEGSLSVCASDDGVAFWPRFAKVTS